MRDKYDEEIYKATAYFQYIRRNLKGEFLEENPISDMQSKCNKIF